MNEYGWLETDDLAKLRATVGVLAAEGWVLVGPVQIAMGGEGAKVYLATLYRSAQVGRLVAPRLDIGKGGVM